MHSLLLLAVVSPLHAASPGLPVLERSPHVQVMAVVAPSPDAHQSQIVALDAAGSHVVASYSHPAGMLPKGTWDAARSRTWLVVPVGRGPKDGTGRVVVLEKGKQPKELMTGVMAVQRPVLLANGDVLVLKDDGFHERAVRHMEVWRVGPSGEAVQVHQGDVAWMQAVGERPQGILVLEQMGENARVVRLGGKEAEVVWKSASPLLRDVVAGERGLWGVEHGPGGATLVEVVDGERKIVAQATDSAMAPLRVGTGLVWSAGAGNGLRVLGGKALAVRPGWVVTPVASDTAGQLVVTRRNTADKRGKLDGRLPAVWEVVWLDGRAAGRLATKGALLEILGVDVDGSRP